MSQSKQCVSCKHYSGAHTCDAFFEGIPIEIMTGMVNHLKPYVGDNEIQFELADKFLNTSKPKYAPTFNYGEFTTIKSWAELLPTNIGKIRLSKAGSEHDRY